MYSKGKFVIECYQRCIHIEINLRQTLVLGVIKNVDRTLAYNLTTAFKNKDQNCNHDSAKLYVACISAVYYYIELLSVSMHLLPIDVYNNLQIGSVIHT